MEMIWFEFSSSIFGPKWYFRASYVIIMKASEFNRSDPLSLIYCIYLYTYIKKDELNFLLTQFICSHHFKFLSTKTLLNYLILAVVFSIVVEVALLQNSIFQKARIQFWLYSKRVQFSDVMYKTRDYELTMINKLAKAWRHGSIINKNDLQLISNMPRQIINEGNTEQRPQNQTLRHT